MRHCCRDIVVSWMLMHLKFEVRRLRYEVGSTLKIRRNVLAVEAIYWIRKFCGFQEMPTRGLYPKAALLSHDCVGNTFISLDENKLLRIYSSVDIEVGMTIYNNYTFALSLSVGTTFFTLKIYHR